MDGWGQNFIPTIGVRSPLLPIHTYSCIRPGFTNEHDWSFYVVPSVKSYQRGDFPETLHEDLLKYKETTNPIPARQTALFNEITVGWGNNAIKWSDFACENSNNLGKRFRTRSGELSVLSTSLPALFGPANRPIGLMGVIPWVPNISPNIFSRTSEWSRLLCNIGCRTMCHRSGQVYKPFPIACKL